MLRTARTAYAADFYHVALLTRLDLPVAASPGENLSSFRFPDGTFGLNVIAGTPLQVVRSAPRRSVDYRPLLEQLVAAGGGFVIPSRS